MDQRHGHNTIGCILGYHVILILFNTMVSGVVVIYCSERPKMWGNGNKIENIIRLQYTNMVKTT